MPLMLTAAAAGERLLEHFAGFDLRHVEQPPSLARLTASGFLGVQLIDEQSRLTLHDAVIMRLGDAQSTLIGNSHQALVRDREVQSLVDRP